MSFLDETKKNGRFDMRRHMTFGKYLMGIGEAVCENEEANVLINENKRLRR